MKVVVAAGGRFHALHLAQQLAARNSLHKLLTFSYTSADKQLIPSQLVSQSNACKFMDQTFARLRLARLIQPSTFNVMKDNVFDSFITSQLEALGSFDLFVGWAHYVLNSIPSIKKVARKVIIESGSCHILEQREILEEEYNKNNLHFPAIHPKNYEKMLQEYDAADYIVTPSKFSEQSFLKRGFSQSKIIRIPCGMDVSYFYDNKHRSPEKFRVIFVGLLSIRKGIHYLLDAWNKLNIPVNQAELILVGSIQKDLHELLKGMNLKSNIHFYGTTNRSTLRKLYQRSSLFVLPTIEDGFGMVIGEAMASGLPVITTTSCAGPDLFDDTQEGFSVPPKNSRALADKIGWCFENQDTILEMGRKGQERIKSCNWEQYGETVFSTYQKILGNS